MKRIWSEEGGRVQKIIVNSFFHITLKIKFVLPRENTGNFIE